MSLIAEGKKLYLSLVQAFKILWLLPENRRKKSEQPERQASMEIPPAFLMQCMNWMKEVMSLWWTEVCSPLSAGSGGQEQINCHARLGCILSKYFLSLICGSWRESSWACQISKIYPRESRSVFFHQDVWAEPTGLRGCISVELCLPVQNGHKRTHLVEMCHC